MKVVKTYSYALTEGTLEKDLDKFIRDTKNGAYQFDYKYGQEGLKLIKAYFRLIEEEFKKQNYSVARACYKKLMFLLLQNEYNYFDYDDIVGKLNFEKFIGNYFICLIKLCTIEELFNEYVEYLKIKEDYYFESADKTILAELSEQNKREFLIFVEKAAEKTKNDDYAMHDLIHLLLSIPKSKGDRATYNQLCEKYEKILGEDLKEDFESQ